MIYCGVYTVTATFTQELLLDTTPGGPSSTERCIYDIVEAHCYFVDIGRIDREQIRSRINNNDCRTFRPRRPLSTAYKTKETAV